MHKNKKAGLELFINILIISIITILVLGFALRFTKNVFTGINDDFFTINEQLKNQIQNYMLEGNAKLYFPSTDIKVNKGESKILGIGINNKKDEALRYKIIITGKDQNGASISANNWFQNIDRERTINPTENHIGNIKLIMPKSVTSGSYSLTLEIVDIDKPAQEDVYESKDFFIAVMG